MIWRVRGTRAFSELRRGHRGSDGPLRVIVVLDEEQVGDGARPPRVAYAIGRRTGSAVTRNRLRRQLREIVRSLPQTDLLPPGSYLVAVGPEAAGATSTQLRTHLEGALAVAHRRAARAAPPVGAPA